MNGLIKDYTFIKKRKNGVDIYKHISGSHFLKIGSKSEIDYEMRIYNTLKNYDIQIPHIIESGSIDDRYFFKESSVGDFSFADIFKNDFINQGFISNDNIDQYTSIVSNHTKNQINLQNNVIADSPTYTNIFGELVSDGFVDITKINILQSIIKEYMQNIPIVYNHGDFNPYNIFPKGIIDIEDGYNDYLGVDSISFLHNYWFPCILGPIPHRSFCYTIDQIRYILSKSSNENINLENPQIFGSLFLIRGIWACANMDKSHPKYIYRYTTLDKLINLFIKKENIYNIVLDTINTDLYETLRKYI